MTAQAPPLRQNRDTFGGILLKYELKSVQSLSLSFSLSLNTHTHTHTHTFPSCPYSFHVTKTFPLLHNFLSMYKDPKLATDLTNTLTPSIGSSLSSSYSACEEFRGFQNLNICFRTQEPVIGYFYSP